jgi:hypothetical protein
MFFFGSQGQKPFNKHHTQQLKFFRETNLHINPNRDGRLRGSVSSKAGHLHEGGNLPASGGLRGISQVLTNPPHPTHRQITESVAGKGVGPSTILAWHGWKQPDISVEVDIARLETSRTDAGVLKKLSLAGIANLSRLKYS